MEGTTDKIQGNCYLKIPIRSSIGLVDNIPFSIDSNFARLIYFLYLDESIQENFINVNLKEMKKILIILMLAISLPGFSYAQTPQHVLGLRFGTGGGFGTEISYQHGLSAKNRLELDLGFNSHYENYLSNKYNYTTWGLTGLYQWVQKIDSNVNWYLGGGAKIGSWSYDHGNVYQYKYNNGIFLAAAGDVGIEYTFPIGIQLALDARPEIGLINHGTAINVGFAVRYQFK